MPFLCSSDRTSQSRSSLPGRAFSFHTTLNTATNIGGSGLSCRFVWNTPLSSWDRGKVTGTAGGSTTGLAPRRRRRLPRFCPARPGNGSCQRLQPIVTGEEYAESRRIPATSVLTRECTGAATVESSLGWCVPGSATSARADDTRQRRQARPLSIMFQYMKAIRLLAVSSGIDAGWVCSAGSGGCTPTVPGGVDYPDCGIRTRSGRRA